MMHLIIDLLVDVLRIRMEDYFLLLQMSGFPRPNSLRCPGLPLKKEDRDSENFWVSKVVVLMTLDAPEQLEGKFSLVIPADVAGWIEKIVCMHKTN